MIDGRNRTPRGETANRWAEDVIAGIGLPFRAMKQTTISRAMKIAPVGVARTTTDRTVREVVGPRAEGGMIAVEEDVLRCSSDGSIRADRGTAPPSKISSVVDKKFWFR
ncbi:hypothetical protein K2X85_09410 [bacterium]|nr:hypothetical protein [bacterium]